MPRAFGLLLLRTVVVRWFEESVDALGNTRYDEDAVRAVNFRIPLATHCTGWRKHGTKTMT
ncbi:hypothetical protein [Bifidobacterium olomucense]|uniref:Uncharacterized protein n=1 Tax=Bifidobacterium olomucense TaxID=2675324 RepID=A0A7Y0EWV3_9BIFI|nr:hypothetical protein [Bifidobacterium sp. DSM 109959]NMM97513.1 hypothetical protein [Bifidobacterium sp. DSM 109959]